MNGRAVWLTALQRDATAAHVSASERSSPADAAVEATREASRFASRLTHDLRDGSLAERIACAPGCSWCCRTQVAVTVPELLEIVRFLDDDARRAERERVHERARDAALRVSELADLGRAARWAAAIPCPLLDGGGRCTVHPVRPIRCRGWNSFDATACERIALGDPVGVEIEAVEWEVHRAVAHGLAEGLERVGLDGSRLELVRALAAALEPGALASLESRFSAGEPVLASARIADAEEPSDARFDPTPKDRA